MFQKNLVRKTEVFAYPADLVLEKVAQGLDECKWHVFGQTSDIVVGLDGGGRTFYGNGLDDVRIEGSLDEPGDSTLSFPFLEFLGFLGKDGDEFPANDFALLLGVSDAHKLVQEAVRSVHADDAEAQAIPEHLQSVRKFVFPEHSGVDEDICEAVAHGAVNEDSRDGRVHSPA